jgi:hypothetical protein
MEQHNTSPTYYVGLYFLKKKGEMMMRALMPFDTEKERKPLKIWEMGFSWRQTAYLSVSLLLFIQLVQWTYNESFPLVFNLIVIFMCLMVFIPGVVFGFVRHTSTGLFLDKYLLYFFRHKKRESGIWRRF